jgi:hypothetical protein
MGFICALPAMTRDLAAAVGDVTNARILYLRRERD